MLILTEKTPHRLCVGEQTPSLCGMGSIIAYRLNFVKLIANYGNYTIETFSEML